MASTTPFYDPTRSYEENYKEGPFGLFRESPPDLLKRGKAEFFGTKIDLPFGIPAGPLLNGRFVEAAWKWGYSIPTYKTVRGNTYPTHPFPNVVKVSTDQLDIHPGETVQGDLDVAHVNVEQDGITNSFGVPSKEPEVWQEDVRHALSHKPAGSTMILSFMGTKTEEMDRKAYIDDFARTCSLARATGAPVLEVNLSCPNFGKEGLICQDLETTRDILTSLSSEKGNVPLLVKIGYFSEDQHDQADQLIEVINRYADGVSAINTIAAKVVDAQGAQLLPGNPVRLSSGVCGAKIRWAGLFMAEYIMQYKQAHNLKDMVVIGVGGVTKVADYLTYMKLGVDAVQSATGAMWKPTLALDIREQVLV